MQDSQIDSCYTKLSTNLEDLVKVYRTLLDVIRKEKELLLSADAEKLMENNKTKEACLFKLRSLDSHRERYARELAHLTGADASQPRLLELATKLSGDRGEKLRSLHSMLELIVNRAHELNKENEVYAQSALATMEGALGEIKQTLAPKKGYGRNGKLSDTSERSGHFVSKET